MSYDWKFVPLYLLGLGPLPLLSALATTNLISVSTAGFKNPYLSEVIQCLSLSG